MDRWKYILKISGKNGKVREINLENMETRVKWKVQEKNLLNQIVLFFTTVIIGCSCRVTLVVAFSFLPQNCGR